MISSCFTFLTHTIDNHEIFNNIKNNFSDIINRIILPNLVRNDYDIINEEPLNYIRQDLEEGGDPFNKECMDFIKKISRLSHTEWTLIADKSSYEMFNI